MQFNNKYLLYQKNKVNFYECLVSQICLEDTYEVLCKHSGEKLQTGQVLSPYKLTMGASPKDVKKKMGVPSCILADYNDFAGRLIFFFKKNIEGQKIYIQCHFFRNELYYIESLFWNYTTILKERLIHLFEKQLQLNLTCRPFQDYFIADPMDTRLFISENVYLVFQYIFQNEALKSFIKNALDQYNKDEKINKCNEELILTNAIL